MTEHGAPHDLDDDRGDERRGPATAPRAQTAHRVTGSPRGIASALAFFRASAIVAGLAMFVLIVEMFLKYGPPKNDVLAWWSPVHGLIFMVFVVATVNLGFKVGWSMLRMVWTIVLACIPFKAFTEERRVVREVAPLTAA